MTQKASFHYELCLWPPAVHGCGQEPATVHTSCNFPKVVFLMVTGMGIADIGLSYAGSPAGAVGFFFLGGGGQTQLFFWENRSRKGKEMWGPKPVKAKRG